MLIDTHCHLTHITSQKSLINALIQEAAQAEVNTIINIGTNLADSKDSISLAQTYPSVYATIGLHPNDATDNWREECALFKGLLEKDTMHRIVGIGECGLDYHYPHYNKQRQYDVFKAQIELALHYNRALVIHTRDAHDETLYILDAYKNEHLRGTIHCFSETTTFAQHAIELGFVLGIGGTITYPKNTHLRETIQKIGLNHLILETDAPFLPPQIIRGKQNHPLHIKTIAHYIANLLHVSYEEIAEITTRNAKKIFNL